MKKAYSTLVIKAVDEDAREITGIASTPGTDRMDDIVEPSGAEFTLPIPLLWQHRHDSPIGQVVRAKVTEKGIEVLARLVAPTADMPAAMTARLQEAWHSIKTGLVRGLSIGFNPKEYSFMDNGGIHFLKWDWTELSAVTIPANAEATITAIKSFDQEQRAAIGKKAAPVVRVPAGASATRSKSIQNPKPEEGRIMSKTIAEQLAGYRAAKEEKTARMAEIMKAAGEEGVTLDADQTEEFDTLEAEVEALEKHISRLERMEKSMIKTAKPVTEDLRNQGDASRGMHHRAPAIVRSVKNDEPGVEFARHAIAMFMAKGNTAVAAQLAKDHYGDKSPVTKALMAAGGRSIESIMKATVGAANTANPTWAAPLVEHNNYAGDFVEFLRPRTIVGQFGQGGIPSMRRIPFNVHIKGQTSGGSGYWVGEGAPKPVTKFDFVDAFHGWFKVAGITVATDEMIRFSDPSIEILVRDGLADALVERMNADFIDPTFAGTANISPASILYGATSIPSTGSDADSIRADILALEAVGDAANNPMTDAVYIMHPRTARALSLMQNPLGQAEYPGITKTGGTFMGVPVITSAYVPYDATDGSIVALVNASDLYYSDDGQATVDYSNQASIQMLDNPTNDSVAGTAAQMVSMYQTDSTAFRAHRFVNWSRRRESGAAYLTGVKWGAPEAGGDPGNG